MMNGYENTPERGGNEMDEPMGESVPCVHIYAMPDGSFGMKRSEEPAPEGLETVASMREAMMRAEEMMQGNMAEDEEGAMAARKGYERRASRRMDAPSPGAVFGE